MELTSCRIRRNSCCNIDTLTGGEGDGGDDDNDSDDEDGEIDGTSDVLDDIDEYDDDGDDILVFGVCSLESSTPPNSVSPLLFFRLVTRGSVAMAIRLSTESFDA